jgi:N-acetylglutamate synthase-like GNAT family acetyltransferase
LIIKAIVIFNKLAHDIIMLIRSFNIDDKEKLADIFKLNVPKYFAANEIHDFEQYLSQYGETYLTIEHEGKIIGGTGYYVNTSDNSGRITWIFFHPDAKGGGSGKKAVEYCISILRADTRVNKLVVTTSQFAFKFFEKFGYETVKIEKEYWGAGLDLYLMEQPN